MGREIRRVPPNWDHPKVVDSYGRTVSQTMYDRQYSEAEAEWLAELDAFRAGTSASNEYYTSVGEWIEGEGPCPHPDRYRPWTDAEATWFQVWETVSEGTPVSPPFATQEELIEYLAAHGDFWDQKRCWEHSWTSLYGGTYGVSAWGRARAERFVQNEWAPSLAVIDGVMYRGTDIPG